MGWRFKNVKIFNLKPSKFDKNIFQRPKMGRGSKNWNINISNLRKIWMMKFRKEISLLGKICMDPKRGTRKFYKMKWLNPNPEIKYSKLGCRSFSKRHWIFHWGPNVYVRGCILKIVFYNIYFKVSFEILGFKFL